MILRENSSWYGVVYRSGPARWAPRGRTPGIQAADEARAITGGLFMAINFVVASVISRLFFHRDFLASSGGLRAFVTDVLSLLIAVVSTGLIASVAAPGLQRIRRRLGGPNGRAADN